LTFVAVPLTRSGLPLTTAAYLHCIAAASGQVWSRGGDRKYTDLRPSCEAYVYCTHNRRGRRMRSPNLEHATKVSAHANEMPDVVK
jgi:hypothetical protein